MSDLGISEEKDYHHHKHSVKPESKKVAIFDDFGFFGKILVPFDESNVPLASLIWSRDIITS